MDQPVRESYLHFIYMALGPKYMLLLPLAGLAGFGLALLLVLRGKGPTMGPALLFVVPMPFWIGLYGAIDGAIAMYSVIAASTTQPRPSELAYGISLALVAPMIGTMLMVPAYAVAVVGLVVRSLVGDGNQGTPTR